jgi:uncharacterized repeat protein (TIGR03803 family)
MAKRYFPGWFGKLWSVAITRGRQNRMVSPLDRLPGRLSLEALEPRWAPAVTQVAFTTAAQTLTAGQNSAVITIQLEDSSGNTATSGSNITFNLSTTSTAGRFLDTSGQPLSGNSLTIAAGSSSAGFAYLDANGGTPTLMAAGGALGATQQETVNAAAIGQLDTLAFDRFNNGAFPQGGPVLDSNGNLFGTAEDGGPNNDGTVFEVARGSNTITTLAVFNSSSTGYNPLGGLVMDSSGDLFGITTGGGANLAGTVFELVHGSNTITTLASFDFNNGPDPNGGLVMDSSGDLFGTTYSGGPNNDGVVFEVAHGSNTITTLASFNGSNGSGPLAGLVMDSNGDLFGTTELGGASTDGTVFELVHGSNTITTLATFNGRNGSFPEDAPVLDSSGDLFGTTNDGATNNGTVFEVAQGSNTITTLASFNGNNGGGPAGGLVLDTSGDLFGTTQDLGPGDDGTLFEIAAGSSTITTLAAFAGNNGLGPVGGLVMNSNGDLLGTTQGGGANNDGTVFELPASSPLHLAFTTPPQALKAGVALTITVQIKNPDGISVSPNAPVTVGLSSTSSGGEFLSGGQPITSVTILPGSLSSATFQYEDTLPGAPTLTASATGFISGQQQETGAIDHLSIAAPARLAKGAPFSVTVSALDQNGNVDLGYTGPATLALKAGPAGGKLAGKLTGQFTAGQASFPGLSLNKLGTFTLFSPGSSTVLAGTAQVKVVTVTHFGVTVSGVPSTGLVAGQPATFTVSALDASGAVVANYTGTIHFTSTDPQAVKPANYHFTLADNGSHTFSFPLKTAGMQTITVTSTTRPNVTATSPPVLVIAAGFDHLLITGYPKTVVSGQAHSVTVEAADAFDNLLPGFTGYVYLTSSDSAAVGLPAHFQYSQADAGRHTFTGVILRTLGSQSLFASYSESLGHPYIVTVLSPAPGLRVLGPSSVVAGVPFTITVEGLAGSTVDPQFSDTIGFSTSDPYAASFLPGNTTLTTSDKGIRQFTLTLISGGPQTITITDLTRGHGKRVVLTFEVSGSGGGFGG